VLMLYNAKIKSMCNRYPPSMRNLKSLILPKSYPKFYPQVTSTLFCRRCLSISRELLKIETSNLAH